MLGCLLGVSLVQWRLLRRHTFHARWWIVAGLLGAWIGGRLSHLVVQVDWGNDLISIVLQWTLGWTGWSATTGVTLRYLIQPVNNQ